MGKGFALCKPACFLARKEAGHKTGKQCMWPTTCDFCLLVAAPPNPLEHRISFCGYTFFERYCPAIAEHYFFLFYRSSRLQECGQHWLSP